ncbi:bifunctional metallophosphatase/5'-nucleotidase [Enterococcus sp. LJL98]
MEQIRIIHTNDLHSHLEKWPKIRRFIQERQRPTADEAVMTVDLGDFSDRWHPLTEATQGKANVGLMNQVQYDYATIGNNEGTGNSKAELDCLYEEANFQVLLANLFDNRTLALPHWAKPYHIQTTAKGTKVGFIGLTAYFPLTYQPNGWDIRAWQEVLPQLAVRLKKEVDVLVLLSHLGVEEDIQIAKEIPAIDVILGSHTHHLFEKGELVNETLLAAAGRFGLYVGEVELEINQAKQIVRKQARTFPTDEMLALPEDVQEIEGYLQAGQKQLQQFIVGQLPRSLPIHQPGQNDLVSETLTALKNRGQTAVAMLNTGLFLGPLSKGPVNQEDLHQILPHPMHLIRVTLQGRDFIRLVKEIEKNRAFLHRFPIVGMGFRGKRFGEIVYTGFHYDQTNDCVTWQGSEVLPTALYTFTTVDHWSFIPFFPTIEIAGEIEFLFPDFIRTVLGAHLTQQYPVVFDE